MAPAKLKLKTLNDSPYVYRMWGGAVAIEDIDSAMEEARRMR